MHVSDLALVVARVEHEIGEAVKGGHVPLGDVLRPGFLESVDGRGFERDHDRHERVERVEFVEAFGDLDEVGEHLAARLDSLAVEDLFLAPEGGLVEAAREVDDVGRFD